MIHGNAGNNELKLDTIIPNLNNLDDNDLKGPNGLITELDSTQLKVTYNLGDDEGYDESEDEENE